MQRMKLLFAAPFVLLLVLTGCRSRVVKVNLINTSAEPISTIIIDYPSATFGKDKLVPGETFSYAIKPLETGPLKIRFTDAQGHEHANAGPTLHSNQEGTIQIKLTQTSASVEPH